MDRTRPKRGNNSDSQSPPPRTKPRFNRGGYHNRRGDRRAASSSSPAVTTSFKILCHDVIAGDVIGKGGCFLRTVRQETGAWITVNELAVGDEEVVIETADNRRREPDGRPPAYSPAQEALLLVHDRILTVEFELEGEGDEGGRVVSRLVVPKGHVGCLMGKGGKIIEQMRIETKTHIRILPRDHHTPRAVSMAEEIVQVVGDGNAVKKAVAIITSRLKESFHRDRGPFRPRAHSPERFFPIEDEFTHNFQQRSDEIVIASRPVARPRYPPDFDNSPASNRPQQSSNEDLIFRVLCPSDKVERMIDDSGGILELLRDEVGVDVGLSDPVAGSDERVIVVTSDEGPNDELFPAQEALLHIQNQMAEIDPDKGKIVTMRLLVPASSSLDFRRLMKSNIQLLSKESSPYSASGAYDVLQIVDEIRAAREALLMITWRLRSFLFGPDSGSAKSEVNEGIDQSPGASQDMKVEASERRPENPASCQNGSLEEQQMRTGLPRPSDPSPSQKTLEVGIPDQAVPSLIMRSGHKLAQIGEMSGAKLILVDSRADQGGKIVQISGTPEQAERAQSLLQGFILSTL